MKKEHSGRRSRGPSANTPNYEGDTTRTGVQSDRVSSDIRAQSDGQREQGLIFQERCTALLERSAGVALALNPFIGYEKAAEVAKEAAARGLPLREGVLEKRLLSAHQLDEILGPFAMTTPGGPRKGKEKVGLF